MSKHAETDGVVSEITAAVQHHRLWKRFVKVNFAYDRLNAMRNDMVSHGYKLEAKKAFDRLCEIEVEKRRIADEMEDDFFAVKRAYLKTYLAAYLTYSLAGDTDDTVARFIGGDGATSEHDFQARFKRLLDDCEKIALEIGHREGKWADGQFDKLTDKVEERFRADFEPELDRIARDFFGHTSAEKQRNKQQ